jgi:complement component 1 Q subcomponent-binding protein
VSEVDPVPVIEGAEGETAEEEAPESTQPIVTASLVVSKHGHPNAMSIDLDAGEDGLVISNVAMFERSVAVQKGSEGDWARRERYLGPRTSDAICTE